MRGRSSSEMRVFLAVLLLVALTVFSVHRVGHETSYYTRNTVQLRISSYSVNGKLFRKQNLYIL